MIRGFTLIETMVAISILAVALTGPFTAVNNAINSSYTARDQLAASALAQEGLEYIRALRDNNYLNGRAWMHMISTYGCYGASPGQYCVVDPTQGDIHTDADGMTACPTIALCPMLKLSTSNLFHHQAGTDSRFKRVVQLRELSSTEVEVTVRVEWTTARKTYSIVVTDILRDWI